MSSRIQKYSRIYQWHKKCKTINDICLLRIDHILQFGDYINKYKLYHGGHIIKIRRTRSYILVDFFGMKLVTINSILTPHEQCKENFRSFRRGFFICLKCTGDKCKLKSGSGLTHKDSIPGCDVS